ncbi:MAG: hypothetical protein M1511_12995 [Deltaproteobacteria bacterium]|nr:hypothetical protein [Deltaproteobacteria bacterium]
MYMKRMSLLPAIFVLAIWTSSHGAEPLTQSQHPEERDIVIKLLKSIENDQYATFIERGSDYFKSRISQRHFHNVSERLAQHLKNGFDVIFLTEFKEAGLVGTLWKIEYRDGFDDALVKIFLEDGKVAGVWFQ